MTARNVLVQLRHPLTGALLLAVSLYPLPVGRLLCLWLGGRCYLWRLARA